MRADLLQLCAARKDAEFYALLVWTQEQRVCSPKEAARRVGCTLRAAMRSLARLRERVPTWGDPDAPLVPFVEPERPERRGRRLRQPRTVKDWGPDLEAQRKTPAPVEPAPADSTEGGVSVEGPEVCPDPVVQRNWDAVLADAPEGVRTVLSAFAPDGEGVVRVPTTLHASAIEDHAPGFRALVVPPQRAPDTSVTPLSPSPHTPHPHSPPRESKPPAPQEGPGGRAPLPAAGEVARVQRDIAIRLARAMERRGFKLRSWERLVVAIGDAVATLDRLSAGAHGLQLVDALTWAAQHQGSRRGWCWLAQLAEDPRRLLRPSAWRSLGEGWGVPARFRLRRDELESIQHVWAAA